MSDDLFSKLFELFDQPGPINWKLAAEVARHLSGETQPVEPWAAEEFRELARLAEYRIEQVAPFRIVPAPDVLPLDARGWAERNLETYGSLVEPFASSVASDGPAAPFMAQLAPAIIGRDPRAYEAVAALLYALRRQASGGMVQQALGAIENALLDIKAKALGVPVYALFGGPVRERIRLYWSHRGTYRLAWPGPMQIPALRTLDDVVAAGREVVAQGYTALKTNVFLLDEHPRLHAPGFARGDYFPELNAERNVLAAIRDQLAAFREGAGPDVDILVDLNFNFKTFRLH